MDPAVLERLRRNSGVVLEADGRFRFHDAPIENDRVQALFHRGIDVRDDGDVTLTVGRLWCYVEVRGVARFIRSIAIGSPAGEPALTITGLDGVRRQVAQPIVGYAPDDRFYLWEASRRGPALLLRSAHQTALTSVSERGDRIAFGPVSCPCIMLGAVPSAAVDPPDPS